MKHNILHQYNSCPVTVQPAINSRVSTVRVNTAFSAAAVIFLQWFGFLQAFFSGTKRAMLLLFTGLCFSCALLAQKGVLAPEELKKMSLEDLMNIEVTLVSRTPQKLTEAASAIQVITGEAIKHSGATSVAEALRLVSNLQVAQLLSNAWIISARGFNTIFANKLLVMIDGRTVYTPLFGGVLWEMQQVLIEDVDRIEVVSGPGGTLWGANAVNGVINIVTKGAAETQGVYVAAATGTFEKNRFEARYGGKIGKNITYRIYGQHFNRKPTTNGDSIDNHDGWRLSQGGFRADWIPSTKNNLKFQGDYYGGVVKTLSGNGTISGQNVMARWSHIFSERSDIRTQVYFDRYYREDKASLSSDKLSTIDLDFQHRFSLPHQSVLWGVGYRIAKDEADYTKLNAGITPTNKTLRLFNAFLQDEIALSQKLKLVLGTKITDFTYSGVELQPSARLAWNPKEKNTLWAAVSKAVRNASRFDVDYYLPFGSVPAGTPNIAGGPNFVSEKLIAYELGYRAQPGTKTSLSVATFYNVYHDLYSVEALPATVTYQIQNGAEGTSWGAEFSGTCQVSNSWMLRGGYTFFNKNLKAKQGRNFDPSYLGNDVKHQGLLQSMLYLPKNFQFDLVGRYLSAIPKTLATPAIPAYYTVDARLAWTHKFLELSLVGKNLQKKNHVEFGTANIPRSFYAKIACRF